MSRNKNKRRKKNTALIKFRRHLKLSQTEFGMLIGNITQDRISHYETGTRRVPPAWGKKVVKFASKRGYGLTLDELV